MQANRTHGIVMCTTNRKVPATPSSTNYIFNNFITLLVHSIFELNTLFHILTFVAVLPLSKKRMNFQLLKEER